MHPSINCMILLTVLDGSYARSLERWAAWPITRSFCIETRTGRKHKFPSLYIYVVHSRHLRLFGCILHCKNVALLQAHCTVVCVHLLRREKHQEQQRRRRKAVTRICNLFTYLSTICIYFFIHIPAKRTNQTTYYLP